MSTPQGTGPTRTSPMKRYGPLIGVVAVIAIIAIVVTVAGKKDTTTNAGPTSTTTPTGGTGPNGSAPNNRGDVPITYEQAKQEGKEKSITWADNCDLERGRIKFPSVYAPPCLPKYDGDNGGATRDGVTADKITIVNYVPPDNNDLLSRFVANLDPKEKVAETGARFIEMLQNTYETYGRKVEIVNYDGHGAPDDPVSAQADAVTVAEQFHPFASIAGPALTPAYAEELSRRGILCIGCGVALPDQFYQEHQPYIWGALATPEEFLVNLADYVTNRVQGKPAEFAGDPELKKQTRKFGVVHFEQNPPVFTSLTDAVQKCGADRGFTAAVTETYEFDIARMPERATTIIAKLKSEGVTSVVFLGDPIMPIYLTGEATKQNYFPEWIVTGTVLTDTTVLGRKYDKQQWAHAFGLSSLAVRTPRDQSEAWRVHTWYFGQPPVAENTRDIIYAPLQQIFLGIHMAGPKLTEKTFQQGLFNYPLSGGGPTTPHVSYGDHGYFKILNPDTCKQDQPRLDYLANDDMAEIWWDSTAEGPDEQGKTDVPGMWRYVDNGKRYLPGQMAKGDLKAFKPENTATVLDKLAPEEAPPVYPSPKR